MHLQNIRAAFMQAPPRWLGLVWLGLCALALTDLTRQLLGVPGQAGWLEGFIFGATVFGYTVLYPSPRLRVAAVAAGVLAAGCFWALDWPRQLATAVPVGLWMAYYGPVVGAFLRRRTRYDAPRPFIHLRARPVAKPATIALTWAWVTVLLPAPVYAWLGALPLFAGRACFIFALALAYDLVDVEDDRRRNFATLARRLGYRPSVGLMLAALSAAALCVSLNFWRTVYTPAATAALLASLVVSAGALPALLPARCHAGWKKIAIDGLMVAQWALVWLLSR